MANAVFFPNVAQATTLAGSISAGATTMTVGATTGFPGSFPYALAVDYGVWFSHRWRELTDRTPIEITLIAGKVIALAAGTELAGLGAISVADYRGVSTMGIDITIGLVCCLMATLFVAPAIAQLLDPRRQA